MSRWDEYEPRGRTVLDFDEAEPTDFRKETARARREAREEAARERAERETRERVS